MYPGPAELVTHRVPWIYLPRICHFFVFGDLSRAEQGACHELAEQEVMSLEPQLQQNREVQGGWRRFFDVVFVPALS